MMATLLIKDFTQSNRAISAQDGEKVYNAILTYFTKKESVVLDFSGIEITITAFLNSCIGKLYGTYSSDEIKEMLDIRNLQNDEKRLLKLVIDKAKERFNKPNSDVDGTD
jgi:hypothetical protein